MGLFNLFKPASTVLVVDVVALHESLGMKGNIAPRNQLQTFRRLSRFAPMTMLNFWHRLPARRGAVQFSYPVMPVLRSCWVPAQTKCASAPSARHLMPVPGSRSNPTAAQATIAGTVRHGATVRNSHRMMPSRNALRGRCPTLMPSTN